MSRSDGAVRVLRGIAYALGATLGLLSVWVVIARLRYPIDAEWMTGAVRDGVERVRDGKQLYVAPSAGFIPFVYPPLYFWISGLLAKVCSSFVACKVVSIAGTIAAGWGVHRIARALGATPTWSRMALLLFVATYPLTILFYDLERVDGLYAGIVLVGVAVLLSGDEPKAVRSSAIAGALLGLSFFAKQAGLLVFAVAVVGLAIAGERKRAGLVLAAGLVVLVAFGTYLFGTTDGFFAYYCLKLPGAHGIRAERISTFFIVDAPRAFAITAGSVALCVPVVMAVVRNRKKPAAMPWQEVVLAALVGASMAAAFSFRAHAGGWQNVLVAWLPLGCPAFAIVATRLEASAEGTPAAKTVTMTLLAAVALQLLGAMFDPAELAPDAEDTKERDRLVALIRDLEKQGEVMVLPTGNLTKQTTAHTAALYDVLRAGGHAPSDLLEGLAARRWTAIFVDAPVDCDLAQCDELEMAIARSYFVAGRRHDRVHTGMTGYDGRPRWLLRPRTMPLPSDATKDQLFVRRGIEMSLAQMKSAQMPSDQEIVPSDEIENEAAAQLVVPMFR
ncbi:MAG: hypothetical protein JWP87_6252 [Labilithrix sp.]|nr:hypothetical protein [Labilithrix sp.]